MPEAAKKNMHLPLPADLHAELKEQSDRPGAPATVLVREAVEEWVRRKRREQMAEELRAYAVRMTGTGTDLDEELEAAGTDALLEHVP
ncbi:MAG: hypothetical protein WD273_02280 [Trueperaceae bacterium]